MSESKSFKTCLDAIGKPLLAVILTHAHPDHVAGVTNLVKSSKQHLLYITTEPEADHSRIIERVKTLKL